MTTHAENVANETARKPLSESGDLFYDITIAKFKATSIYPKAFDKTAEIASPCSHSNFLLFVQLLFSEMRHELFETYQNDYYLDWDAHKAATGYELDEIFIGDQYRVQSVPFSEETIVKQVVEATANFDLLLWCKKLETINNALIFDRVDIKDVDVQELKNIGIIVGVLVKEIEEGRELAVALPHKDHKEYETLTAAMKMLERSFKFLLAAIDKSILPVQVSR